MKKVVLVLAMAIFSLSVNAQAKLVKNEIDSFTGDTKKITDTYVIGKSKTNSRLSAKIMRINESRFISLTSYGMGCSGVTGNYVIFKFVDGTTLKLDDDFAEIKCKDGSSSLYSITAEDLSKDIEAIRFRQSKYYDDFQMNGKVTIAELINLTKS